MPTPNNLDQYLRAHRSGAPQAAGSVDLPEVARSINWSQQGTSLWLPEVSQATPQGPPGPSPQVAAGEIRGGMRVQTYITAGEIFGEPLPPEYVLDRISAGRTADILIQLARLLTSVELHVEPRHVTDDRWAREIFSAPVAERVATLLREGGVLLPEQGLLVAAKLALMSGATGAPNVEPTDALGQATLAFLGVGDSLGASTDAETGETWGGWPIRLALELVSNQHFNSQDPLTLTVNRFQRVWRELAVREATSRHLVTPERGFLEATGCRLLTAMAIVIAMHAQVRTQGYVRFPKEFFKRIGVSDEERDNLLKVISATQADLTQYVLDEVQQFGLDWSFNKMRQYPLIRLEDDTFLVLSLRFLIERIFGLPFYWQVRNHFSGPTASKLKHTFDNVHAFASEQYVVELARRIAPDAGKNKRVYTEADMKSAWKGRKGQTDRVCDLVVDYGDAWLCIEVVTSRLSERGMSGSDAAALNDDIRRIVTERKVEQLASTIRNLKHREHQLTKRPANKSQTYIPVLLAFYDFPVNDATMAEVRGHLQAQALLQPPISPLVIMSAKELEFLEALVERQGQSAGRLLRDWAVSSRRDAPFDNYLNSRGLPLARPEEAARNFDRVTQEIVQTIPPDA